MQDRNAKAPKVRSGDQINPVLGTIIKISIILVIVALITLTTLIIIEFVKRNKKTVDVFEDRIHITEDDFRILTTGEAFDDLSKEVNEIMVSYIRELEKKYEDSDETPIVEILFFFYYSESLDELKKDKNMKEMFELVGSRGEKQPIFLIQIDQESEDEEGNKLPTIMDYLLEIEELSPSGKNSAEEIFELDALLQRKKDFPYFLLTFNEGRFEEGQNPYYFDYDFETLTTIISRFEKKEEDKK